MTTLIEAAEDLDIVTARENINRKFNPKGYEYLINMMNEILKYYDVKTVGIYGHIEEDGFYRFKAMTVVGPNSPDHRHAEDLLLEGLRMSDIQDTHSFIMLNRIPCEKCMENILRKLWNKLTLMIPSKLDSKSKWFNTQVRALTYMNTQFQIDKDSNDSIYTLVYIDD